MIVWTRPRSRLIRSLNLSLLDKVGSFILSIQIAPVRNNAKTDNGQLLQDNLTSKNRVFRLDHDEKTQTYFRLGRNDLENAYLTTPLR